MNYIYDVLVDFQKDVREFYEWDKKDMIVHIRRCPIIKVSTSTLKDFFYNHILVDSAFLKTIENKTEIFNNKTENYDFVGIFTDSKAVLALHFEANGEIIGRSLLQMEEEEEVLDTSDRMREVLISYKVMEVIPYNPFKTERERKKEDYLAQMILEFEECKDLEKLKYIYYDCFEERGENKEEMLSRLLQEIQAKNSLVQNKLYDFFKLTSHPMTK